MVSPAIRPVVLALLVVLAGCTGFSGGPAASPTVAGDDPSTSPQPTDDRSGDVGQVRFYLSDQPSIIDEFRHLNVTITSVGFQRGGENGSWIEFPVNGTTVDLTELKGANATLIEAFDLPAGNYTTVFVHVDSVDGTLKAGDNVTVKLPSGKLQLNKGFRLGPNESVEFVYDISVHKAGQSGKYILKPVIGQSGTDVPIERVDRDRDRDRPRLEAALLGNVTPGQPATVSVTRNGSAVPNATVFVDGQRVGTTDAQGRIQVEFPADAEELTVIVRAGDAETELELEVDDGDDGGPPDGQGQGQGNGGGN